MSKTIGRIGVCCVGVLAVLAMSASAAFAAGAPKELSADYVLSTSSPQINWVTLTGKANPNGAATTVKFEYRVAASGEFVAEKSTSPQSIGSGTTAVSVEQTPVGLIPNTYYEWRLSATNSYGTIYSATQKAHFLEWWLVGAGPVAAEVTSLGHLSIDWTSGPAEVTCDEVGSGSINHEKGTGDYYESAFSGCLLTSNGKTLCSVTVKNERLDAGFNTSTGKLNVQIPEGCFTYREMELSLPAFKAETSSGPEATKSVTMSASTHNAPAEPLAVTLTSNWKLAGKYVGYKFGILHG
jgi:hypothetical protein